MPQPFSRRAILLGAAAFPSFVTYPAAGHAQADLAALEQSAGGRLGVFAVDTGNGRIVSHRADERFPVTSTFKALLGAAILHRSMRMPGLLEQRIAYERSDLVTYSPVTEKHVGAGMTVAELCAATIQYSDNGAANLLMRTMGGPAGLTAFARSIGDPIFRLDRWEPELNSAIPGDPRDTTTPRAMALSLQRLALGDVLDQEQRRQLQDWLRGNTTGDARIRAGVPAGWIVGDKTGGGDYGSTNDVAILWPPAGAPLVMTVYFTQRAPDAQARSAVVEAAARIAISGVTR